mmetsp:Transcript_50098/g.127508  ORF Transcript_50098/g.127508 Transcript_50098/m.127508 type:complete len:313 (-) Transcript_50098:633-1571(-)
MLPFEARLRQDPLDDGPMLQCHRQTRRPRRHDARAPAREVRREVERERLIAEDLEELRLQQWRALLNLLGWAADVGQGLAEGAEALLRDVPDLREGDVDGHRLLHGRDGDPGAHVEVAPRDLDAPGPGHVFPETFRFLLVHVFVLGRLLPLAASLNLPRPVPLQEPGCRLQGLHGEACQQPAPSGLWAAQQIRVSRLRHAFAVHPLLLLVGRLCELLLLIERPAIILGPLLAIRKQIEGFRHHAKRLCATTLVRMRLQHALLVGAPDGLRSGRVRHTQRGVVSLWIRCGSLGRHRSCRNRCGRRRRAGGRGR